MTDKAQQLDQLIADYVRGRADPEQARKLELAMREDEELSRRVRAEQLRQAGSQSTDQHEPMRGLKSGLFGHWPGKALIGGLTLAVVLLGVYVVALEGQLERATSPSVEVSVLTLPAELPVTAARQLAAGSVLIEIDVSEFDRDTFELELGLGDEAHRWPSVRVNERGYLSVYVPAAEQLRWIRVLDEQEQVLSRHDFRD